MRGIVQDIRFGGRALRRSPGLTVVAALTLGLGIGATTAIFSVVNGVLLESLPYRDPGALVQMWERLPSYENASVAYPNFLDWREQATVFGDMAAFRPTGMNLTGEGDPAEMRAYQVSAGMFTILGVEPALGRSFIDEDDEIGAQPVVILSHALWQSRFGGDPDVVGRALTLDDHIGTVVGVMPRSFVFPPLDRSVDLWIPMGRFATGDSWKNRQEHIAIQVIGRLKPGVTLERARGDMETVALRLEEEYPDSNKGSRVNVASVYERNFGDLEETLLLLVYSVALVLLIACVNVASILLARGTSRQREIAIRSTVGASQSRIARLLLVESVMLWLTGGLVGLALSYAGTEMLSGWLSGAIPRADQIAVGGRALVFVLAVSLLTGVFFGLVPALRSARPDLVESLKEGLRTSGGRSRHRILKGLVVAEVTLAQVLLVVSGLTIHSFALLLSEDPGVDVENLLTLRISLPESAYPELARRHDFFDRLLERVEGIPGVVAAAAGGPLPLHQGGWQSSYHVVGEPTPPPGQAPLAEVSVGTADYHRALGIPLRRGRYFNGADRRDSLPVAIIDETFAERHWPGADPLGKSIELGGNEWEIVGVVGHVKNRGVARESLVQMYLPFEWDNGDTWQLAVRTTTDPGTLSDDVRSAVLELDPNQPISDVGTMEERLSDTTTANRMLTVLLSAFATAALVLASVGIYGVMAYTAGERRHEIGIRMAMGAIRGKVLGMVVRQGLGLALLGIALGLALSMGLGRLISSQLYGITAADPMTFLAAPVFLCAVAALATYLPARRAATVDPTVTLQNE